VGWFHSDLCDAPCLHVCLLRFDVYDADVFAPARYLLTTRDESSASPDLARYGACAAACMPGPVTSVATSGNNLATPQPPLGTAVNASVLACDACVASAAAAANASAGADGSAGDALSQFLPHPGSPLRWLLPEVSPSPMQGVADMISDAQRMYDTFVSAAGCALAWECVLCQHLILDT
jgi:hypothetical protein